MAHKWLLQQMLDIAISLAPMAATFSVFGSMLFLELSPRTEP